MKNIIKSVAFLIVFAFIFSGVMKIFSNAWDYGEETYDVFYSLPKNSVDAVLIGPSGIKYSYLAPVAFNETGMSSYPLANSGMPFSAVKHVIIEAEKTQSPKVYVIDLRKVCDENTNNITSIHGVADSFKWSKNRFDVVTTMLKEFEGQDINKIEYYFPFSQNHKRWNELSKYDFTMNENLIMGCILQDNPEKIMGLDKNSLNIKEEPFGGYPLEVLNDFLDFCDNLDAEVLFIQTPHSDTDKLGKLKFAENLIKSRGYEVLDANYYLDEMDYNFDYDSIDPKHSGIYGAVKYTTWLANKLTEKYGLENHKNDKKYAFWGNEYERFLELRLKNTNSLHNYANIINEDRYYYFAYLVNDENKPIKQDISKIGLTVDSNYRPLGDGLHITVYEKGKIIDEVCFDVFSDIAYPKRK